MKRYKFSINTFYTVTLLLFFTGTIPALEPELRAKINNAIETSQFEEITTVLSESLKETQTDIETYVLQEARKAILSNKLETARKLAETILLFNFDNTVAQELFLSVEEARTQQRLVEERRLQAEQAERERIQAEQDRIETERLAQQKAEEEARKQAERDALVKSVTTFGTQNIGAHFAINPVSIHASASEFADIYSGTAISNWRYAFGFYGKTWFNHPYILAALEGYGIFAPVLLTGQDTTHLLTGRFMFGVPFLLGPFVLTAGYQSIEYEGTNNASSQSVLVTQYAGPTFGAGIHNVNIAGIFDSTLFVEWNSLSAVDPLVDMILSAELQVSKKALRLSDNIKLSTGALLNYNIVTVRKQVEWALATSIFVGVSINEK